MIGADSTHEQVAQRLAAQGRDALVQRLRHAYAEAAEAHADVLSIDADRLETMVQGAADRADGLQWRRALADVASGELGISVNEALGHPAVLRAQELVGAPSYDDSLAALFRGSVAAPISEASRSVARDREPDPVTEAEPASQTPEREPARPEAKSPWESIAQPGMLEAQFSTAPDVPGGAAGDDAVAERPIADEAEGLGQPHPEQPDTESSAQVEDPLATQQFSPDDVAAALAAADAEVGAPRPAGPPRPTHVVPAPVPPETTAGEQRSTFAFTQHDAVANGGSEPLVGDRPAPGEWAHDSYEYDPGDDAGLEDEQSRFELGYGPEGDEFRVTAIHLGGVANLPISREGIDLRLSAHGLDIIRGGEEIVGRLAWPEIDSFEVPLPRGRRRRTRDRARLIVRTSQGDASFDVPGCASDELRSQILPLFARFGHR